jgi:hypothetical protein
LKEYLKQEKSLWRSKSRVQWLTCKDLNIKFFYTNALIRHRRNAIDRLYSPNAGWLTDRIDIGDCFVSHFNDLFTSSTPLPNDELLDLFQSYISHDENIVLYAIPTESEIFVALSSLEISKALGSDGITALFYILGVD